MNAPGPLRGTIGMRMRQLYRLEHDKIVAGVCAGLADMLGIDPNIVRLVLCFLAVFLSMAYWELGAALLGTYLAAWFLLPVGGEEDDEQ